jgi:hypothetical protein
VVVVRSSPVTEAGDESGVVAEDGEAVEAGVELPSCFSTVSSAAASLPASASADELAASGCTVFAEDSGNAGSPMSCTMRRAALRNTCWRRNTVSLVHMLARADTMTAHLFNLLLQSSNSRLAAVVPDQRSDSIILQLDVGRLETGALLGLRREIFARDRSLFFRDVARDLEDLHSVEERGRDRVEGVGGADKQDSRQVDRNVELHVRFRGLALMQHT